MEKFKFLVPREARMSVGAVGSTPGGFDQPVLERAELAVDGTLLLDFAELEEEACHWDWRLPARLDVRWPGAWAASCGEGPSDLFMTLGGRFYAVSPSGSMRTDEVRVAAVADLLSRRGALLRALGAAEADGRDPLAASCGPVRALVDVPHAPTPGQRGLALEAARAVAFALRRAPVGPPEAEAAANAALGSEPWRAAASGLTSGEMAVVLVPWDQAGRGGK